MALHCDADMVRAIVGACQVKFLSGRAGRQGEDALAETRCADVASRCLTRGCCRRPSAASARVRGLCCCGGGGRPGSPSGRRLADAQQHARGGLEIGQLAVTVARSVSRRASRSPTFVFSALIWSNILGVVRMVAFSGFRSIATINLAGV